MEINRIEACTVKYDTVKVSFDTIVFNKRITLLEGINGCGKSTLLKKISGVFGKTMAKSFRYALELPSYPLDLKVVDILNAFLKYDEFAKSDKQVDLINLFDFAPFLYHKCTELSKGNKMKLNLILTLQAEVDLYLLDEPFSGLDSTAKYRLSSYIKRSSSQFIITSHLKENLFGETAEVIRL